MNKEEKNQQFEYRYENILYLNFLKHVLILLKIKENNFMVSEKNKKEIDDLIDGEYLEKTEKQIKYYEGLIK